MGKRKRKKKTQPKELEIENEKEKKIPKTFVFAHRGSKKGKQHYTTDQKLLAQAIRRTFRPYTAVKLQQSRRNRLTDFLKVSGMFGVSHFAIVTSTDKAYYLKFIKVPRGPTISFKIEKFSLPSDIQKALKSPRNLSPREFDTQPLLILSNFVQKKDQGEGTSSLASYSELISIMFQNMLPKISVKEQKVSDFKRVILFHLNPENEFFEFRHYKIEARTHAVSTAMRSFLTEKNLDKLSEEIKDGKDISEYILSKSKEKTDDEDGEAGGFSIVLHEIGPRIDMRLIKIEEGINEGTVLYHTLVKKSKEDVAALHKKSLQKKNLKAERKRTQEMNVQRKQMAKERAKSATSGDLDMDFEEEGDDGIDEMEDEDPSDINTEDELEILDDEELSEGDPEGEGRKKSHK